MQTNISKTQIIDGQLISFAQFDNLIDNLKPDNSDVPDFQLVFLHGWASNKELWANLINDLFIENEKNNENETLKNLQIRSLENGIGTQNKLENRLKFKILTLDLPGFGASQKPKSDWFVSDYADLVLRFIEKNCQKNIPIIIVGHSFGGRIGIKLASENFEKNLKNTQNKLSKNQSSFSQKLSQKDYQISKLILIGSAGFVDNSLSNGVKKTIAKVLKPVFKFKIMQNLKKQIYQKILKNDDYLNTSMKQTFVNTIDEDLAGFMKEIKIPTLLIFGDKDTETPPTFGQRMNKLIPNSILQIISGNHFAFVDKSKEIADLIADFLR